MGPSLCDPFAPNWSWRNEGIALAAQLMRESQIVDLSEKKSRGKNIKSSGLSSKFPIMR